MNTIKILEYDNLTWINITHPGEKELGFLASNFDFLDIDLKDCLPPLQRPKLVERDGYLFMILQFPVYNRETKKIHASEIDFFILPDKLITVHNDELVPLERFYNTCQKEKALQKNLLYRSAWMLLYQLLEALLLSCFPMLNHISWDTDEVEKKIFTNFTRETISEILNIRRNIVYFRKAMREHKNVIKKLGEKSQKFQTSQSLAQYFEELIEYTKEIWDLLENYQNSIDALHETHESLADFRLNSIIKTLTVFSVIILPLTLLANIFSVNTLGGMPFINHPLGFWSVVLIIVLGSVGMYIYFKKRGWI